MTNLSLSRFESLFGHRPRLAGALVAGAILALCLPHSLSVATRAILGWDLVAIIYLTLTMVMLFHKNTAEWLKKVAAAQDQNRWMILGVMTIASFASLGAIFTLLADVKSLSPEILRWHVLLGAVTVLASWSMMHMIFAVHYAHEYYGDADASPTAYEAYQGLMFPGGKEPVFSDFMYYGFVVGMTCQVSDVQVSSQVIRRLTLLHGVLAFFFNTVVLALSVNIAASLLG